MNAPIAENKYTLTKELFYEGMKLVSKENYSPFAKKAVICLAAAWIVMAAVTLLLRQSPLYIAFEAVVLLIAALWVALYMPWHKRRLAYKKLTEKYGSDMERTTVFFEDKLTVNAAGYEVTVPYDDIEKTLSSDNLYILLAKNRTGILIHRSGFTLGQEADVDALIGKFK